MDPLQPNNDELLGHLSSSSGSKGSGSLGAASLLFNLVSWLGSNVWSDVRMQRQNQQNLLQWQRENAYNSPSAQMQRLRLAGLNPAMVFANGDMMNEAAASPQLESYPVSSPVQIDPLTAAQIDLMESQAMEHRSNVPVNEQRAEELRQSARNLRLEGNFAAVTFSRRVGEYLVTSGLNIKKASEELKYAAQNIKNDADRLQSIADKARNEKLISDEQYSQAKEITRKMRAEADITEKGRNEAEFKSYIYGKALDAVKTALEAGQSILRIINHATGTVREEIEYFFPDDPNYDHSGMPYQ